THLFHWKMAIGSVFRAELARGMQELGFSIEAYEQGSSVFFRVRGVPEELVEFWSKRRAEIEEKLKVELGSLDAATAIAFEIAALETRRKKDDERPRSELHAEWEADGRRFAFTPEYIQTLRTPYQEQSQAEKDRHKEEIWRQSIAKLSYHLAHWDESEMTKVVADRSAGKLSALEVRELIAH